MKFRRDGKREIINLHQMLAAQDMTEQNRLDISAKIKQIEESLREGDPEYDQAEIDRRREILASNQGLYDIFKSMWATVAVLTDSSNRLTKTGYVRFQLVLMKALGTYGSDDLARASAEEDWEHDCEVYGPIDKTIFFYLLFEVIETYTTFIDPMYYSAFAWALLDAVSEVRSNPPKLRPLRTVNCIMKTANEANLLTSFYNPTAKKERATMKLKAELMDRIPDVQKRLAGRRDNNLVDSNQLEMIAAMARLLKKDNINDRDETLTDSDDEGESYEEGNEFGYGIRNRGETQTSEADTNTSSGKRSYFKRSKEKAAPKFGDRGAWMTKHVDWDLVNGPSAPEESSKAFPTGGRPGSSPFSAWITGTTTADGEAINYGDEYDVSHRPLTREELRNSYKFYRPEANYLKCTETSQTRSRERKTKTDSGTTGNDTGVSTLTQTLTTGTVLLTSNTRAIDVNGTISQIVGQAMTDELTGMAVAPESNVDQHTLLQDDTEFQELMLVLGQVSEKSHQERIQREEAEKIENENRARAEAALAEKAAEARARAQERAEAIRSQEQAERLAAEDKINTYYQEALSRELVITPAQLRRQELAKDVIGDVPALRPSGLATFSISIDLSPRAAIGCCVSQELEQLEASSVDNASVSSEEPAIQSSVDAPTALKERSLLGHQKEIWNLERHILSASPGTDFAVLSSSPDGHSNFDDEGFLPSPIRGRAKPAQSFLQPKSDESPQPSAFLDSNSWNRYMHEDLIAEPEPFPHELYSDVVVELLAKRTTVKPTWSHRRALAFVKKPLGVRLTRNERKTRELQALDACAIPRGHLGRSKHSLLQNPRDRPTVLTNVERSRLELAARGEAFMVPVERSIRPMMGENENAQTLSSGLIANKQDLTDAIATATTTNTLSLPEVALQGNAQEQQALEASFDDELVSRAPTRNEEDIAGGAGLDSVDLVDTLNRPRVDAKDSLMMSSIGSAQNFVSMLTSSNSRPSSSSSSSSSHSHSHGHGHGRGHGDDQKRGGIMHNIQPDVLPMLVGARKRPKEKEGTAAFAVSMEIMAGTTLAIDTTKTSQEKDVVQSSPGTSNSNQIVSSVTEDEKRLEVTEVQGSSARAFEAILATNDNSEIAFDDSISLVQKTSVSCEILPASPTAARPPAPNAETKQPSLSIRSVRPVLPHVSSTRSGNYAYASPKAPPATQRVVLERRIDDVDVVLRTRDFIQGSQLPRGIPVPGYPPAVEVMTTSVAGVINIAPSVSSPPIAGSSNPSIKIIPPNPLALPPWMEPGTMGEVDHNRSSKVLAWKERQLVLRHGPPEGWTRAKVVHSIMRQDGLRQRLEFFSLDKQLGGHLLNDPKAIHFAASPTISKSTITGKTKAFHDFQEKTSMLSTIVNAERVRHYNRLRITKKDLKDLIASSPE